MAIINTDWQSFLYPDSEIPPDVFFLVKESDGKDEESKRIGAHRLLLAGTSPVFRRMFFGPMKETGEVVEVKDTTPEAFEAMIDYIYMPPDEWGVYNPTGMSCPQKLFDLLSHADRCEILDLVAMTSDVLQTLRA